MLSGVNPECLNWIKETHYICSTNGSPANFNMFFTKTIDVIVAQNVGMNVGLYMFLSVYMLECNARELQ